MATERRRAKVRRQHDDWAAYRSPAITRMPDRVVFIDETAVKTNLTRLRGWATHTERILSHLNVGSGGDVSILDLA